MSLENQLHADSDSGKEQRITHLRNRFNQLNKNYPTDIATRKSIEAVHKPANEIYLDYKAENAKVVEEHVSMLDQFQRE